MNFRNQGFNRRQFVAASLGGAGALVWGAKAWAEKSDRSSNPFAYEVDRLAKTDPKLLGYELVRQFASPHPEPRRIAVGPEDRIYLATRAGVAILDAEGNSLRTLEVPGPARCVAVAADGTVYAGVRDHIEVFDPQGQRVAAWEAPGKKVWFTGLAAGEKEVFAADSANRVVLRYDRSGRLSGKLGEKNQEHNVPGLIVPSPYLDVALGRDGLLRVNNPGRHCVEVYTTAGELELSWGKPSAAIAGFCGCCNPIGVAMLPDGRCITCEKGLPRVKVYGADQALECVVAGPESFPANGRAGSVHDLSDGSMGGLDAGVDSKGKVYVLDLVAADVRVMQRKA
jgi:hypothetical protein